MSPPRTLLVDEQGLTAYRRQGGQWISEGHFSQTPADIENFSRYLQQHRQQPFRLLADLAQEEIVLENIPRLRGGDRQALIARKLEQHFPGQTLRCASPLGPERGTPAREKLRLSTFAQTTYLTCWLSPIAAQHSRLSGIYSSSQLAGTIQQALGKTAEHRSEHSLLFVQSQTTLRQFFLRHGQLELARSVPVDAENCQQIGQEASKLQHYLLNQHLLGRGEGLPVLVLGHGAASDYATDTLTFHFFPEITDPQPLFLTALEHHPPRTQFASPCLLRAEQLACRRFAANTLAALFTLTCLPLAAVNGYETEILQQETTRLLAAERHPQAAGDTAPSAATLRHLNDRYDELRRTQQLPRAALTQLSRSLEQHPNIQLETLIWQNTNGRDSLTISGHVSGTPEQQETQLVDFLAALRVDRDRPVNLRPSPEETDSRGIWRGSHAQDAAPSIRNFHIDIGVPP